MLTLDDIRAVPLFSTLAEPELDLLARTSADVQLSPGEYAVHEGGEPALFAVLAGKIEVVKFVDGSRAQAGLACSGHHLRRGADRAGYAVSGRYRAAEPSRVMRVEPCNSTTRSRRHRRRCRPRSARWRANASAGSRAFSPSHRSRASPSSGIASTPPAARCAGSSSATRSPLSGSRPIRPTLTTRWPGAERRTPIARCSPRRRDVVAAGRAPAIWPSGSACRPVRAPDEYDTVIIGGGPAGFAAAVYGASEGLRTLVVEREATGGQAGTSSRIENYLGFPSGVSGDELARRALMQARRLGAEILVTRSITAHRSDDPPRLPRWGRSESVRARTLIFATGVDVAASRRSKASTGSSARASTTAPHGARRSSHRGSTSTSSAPATRRVRRRCYFAGHARSVTLVVRGESLERSMSHYLIEQLRGKSNVSVQLDAEVSARLRRYASDRDRHPRPPDVGGAQARLRRSVRVHRRRRPDRVAARRDRARRPTATS